MVYEKIHIRIRQLVRTHHYYLTLHAEEEMDNDEVSLDELEHTLNEGEITFRQLDARAGEWKYGVTGIKAGLAIEAVVKIAAEQVVVITVYSLGSGLR